MAAINRIDASPASSPPRSACLSPVSASSLVIDSIKAELQACSADFEQLIKNPSPEECLKLRDRSKALLDHVTDVIGDQKTLASFPLSKRVIIHDIKAPFNSIVASLGVLCDDLDNITSYTSALSESLATAAKVINKLDSELSLENTQVHLKSFLERVVAQTKNIDSKNVTVRFSCSNDLSIFVDEVHLNRILNNFISNAVRHSAKGGAVEVLVSPPEGFFVKFEITDHGEGMDPERLEKLGKAFETGEKPPEATTKGTGLGLYGTKELLTLMGSRGGIQVASAKGHGSTFSFDLPMRPSPMSLLRITPSLTPALSPAPSSAMASPIEIKFCKPLMKAIFLDDDAVARRLYQMMFNRAVLNPRDPRNIFIKGDSGQALLEERAGDLDDWDICVFDMYMNGKYTGLETAARVHALKPRIPFIIASGDDVTDHPIFKQLGDQIRMINKPLNRHVIVTTINELITLHPAAPQKPDGS